MIDLISDGLRVGFILLGWLIMTLILMGLSVDFKKPRDDAGTLNFKWGFILKNFYRDNSFTDEEKRKTPRTICQLFWGIFLGILNYINKLIVICVASIVILLIFYPIALFFGRIPRYFLSELSFHRYKSYGEKDEKSYRFAPWEIAAFLAVLYFIYWGFYKLLIDDWGGSVLVPTFIEIIKNPWFIYSGGSLALAILIIYLLMSKRVRAFFGPIKEFIIGLKDKVCFGINVDRPEAREEG
jgi:hypothetical protein